MCKIVVEDDDHSLQIVWGFHACVGSPDCLLCFLGHIRSLNCVRLMELMIGHFSVAFLQCIVMRLGYLRRWNSYLPTPLSFSGSTLYLILHQFSLKRHLTALWCSDTESDWVSVELRSLWFPSALLGFFFIFIYLKATPLLSWQLRSLGIGWERKLIFLAEERRVNLMMSVAILYWQGVHTDISPVIIFTTSVTTHCASPLLHIE